MVRDWQAGLMDLLRRESAGKQTSAKALSYGVNGVALVLMVGVFAQTGGLTGAEVVIAGGSSAVGQKLVEALLGDQAVRRLTADARSDLERRVDALIDVEAARFDAALAPHRPSDHAGRLRQLADRLRTEWPRVDAATAAVLARCIARITRWRASAHDADRAGRTPLHERLGCWPRSPRWPTAGCRPRSPSGPPPRRSEPRAASATARPTPWWPWPAPPAAASRRRSTPWPGASWPRPACAGRPRRARRRPSSRPTRRCRPTRPACCRGWSVHQHVVVDDPALDGLVLLDLPDHDSTQAAHRQEVDRLVRVVDVFVWVVDPQKYADAALHHDYLRRFAGHADVTVVVLNQIDTIPPEHRAAALDDLARIVAADGLPVARAGVVAKVTGRDEGVRVMGVSARTGEGIDALRRELAARVSAHRALIDRIDADIDWIADDLDRALGDRPPRAVPDRAAGELGRALAGAVGVDGVTDAVAEAHRRRGAHAAGWPPTRWISRLRPDPLRRLGLDRRPDQEPAGRRRPHRSLSPGRPCRRPRRWRRPPCRRRSGGSSTTCRADCPTRGAIGSARSPTRAAAISTTPSTGPSGTARLPTDRPRWWRVVGVVQWLLAAALVVGLLWLLAIFVVAWFNLPDLPTVDIGELPLPTVLAIGGAALGLLLAAITRWATGVGARRRASIARRRLLAAATDVGRDLVIAPLDAELATMTRLHDLVGQLRR